MPPKKSTKKSTPKAPKRSTPKAGPSASASTSTPTRKPPTRRSKNSTTSQGTNTRRTTHRRPIIDVEEYNRLAEIHAKGPVKNATIPEGDAKWDPIRRAYAAPGYDPSKPIYQREGESDTDFMRRLWVVGQGLGVTGDEVVE